MPKWAAQVDRNQPLIVKALREAGAEVWHTYALGQGSADLVVAHNGKWHVMEVKSGKAARLTKDEQAWHAKFSKHAPVLVVFTPEDALRGIGVEVG
jgi:hypothetical protein